MTNRPLASLFWRFAFPHIAGEVAEVGVSPEAMEVGESLLKLPRGDFGEDGTLQLLGMVDLIVDVGPGMLYSWSLGTRVEDAVKDIGEDGTDITCIREDGPAHDMGGGILSPIPPTGEVGPETFGKDVNTRGLWRAWLVAPPAVCGTPITPWVF